MAIWLTNHALTEGIKRIDSGYRVAAGRVLVDGSPFRFTMGKDAHETEAEAVKAAEAGRRAKIESLRRQVKRLLRMRFK